MGKLGATETRNTSKQQSNYTQGAAMHSRLLSKTTCESDMIELVISLFSLRSNNSTMQTSQLKRNNQTESTLVLGATLLPLLQALNSLEVLVF